MSFLLLSSLNLAVAFYRIFAQILLMTTLLVVNPYFIRFNVLMVKNQTYLLQSQLNFINHVDWKIEM